MLVGKNPGYDSVSNEHFKYLNEKIFLMSFLMLIHGFFTGCYDNYNHSPIIKNKAGDLSDNNNYRHIALATIASKLFESRVSTFFIYMCKPIWI